MGRKRGPEPYHHGDLRQALLAASLSLLAKRGPESFSLREVARAAGVSTAAPYHHFEDRASLLAALAEATFGQLAEALRSAVATLREPREQLAALTRAYVDFACAHPVRYRLLYLPEIGDRKRFATLHQTAWEGMAQVIEVLTKMRPDLGVSERLARAAVAWSTCHGFSTLAVEGVIANRPELPSMRRLREALANSVVAAATAKD